ncbi:MAG: histidinol dehydrogenase [Peptococcaceae bacterium]|nr:histidinol dehydrogenase [Peptococcaceae bacterium]
MLRVLDSKSGEIKCLLDKCYTNLQEFTRRTTEIVADVRVRGDAALVELALKFDGFVVTPDTLQVTDAEFAAAYQSVSEEFLAALRRAHQSISEFHQKQVRTSWLEPDEQGNILGQVLRPLERVGIYVPGGTAAYPSSVLMNAVPARVAGVKEIAMVTPVKSDGIVTPEVLVAAKEAGVSEVYKVGGAQAIAALAYGTKSIKKVDKITGPGNIYVTLAKKMVYGEVDIDMLAGPSEILIVADESADAAYVAADMLSQAEHDVLASAILITPTQGLIDKVLAELERQLADLPRREIAQRSLADYGAVILADSVQDALNLANRFAPEHLELMLAEPFQYLGQVQNAGAVFLGQYSPEPLGDYYAGPNHVLPTGGTARFYSPLSVDTFTKKTSVIAYSQQGLCQVADDVMLLAETEGLAAHARAIKVRVNERGV